MKTKFALLSALLLITVRLQAAVLTGSTPVHTQPDDASPVVSYLPAGTNTSASNSPEAKVAAGWMAVDLNTPFEAFVNNRDINKSLDVLPGSVFRTHPKADAPVLATMEAGDTIKITGLRGKWTQVAVKKKLVAYIRSNSVSSSAPVPTPQLSAPASTATTKAASDANASSTKAPAVSSRGQPTATPAPALLSPAPVPAAAYTTAPQGQAVARVDLGDGGPVAIPRSYAGKFASSRRPFAPKRPYDFQINDDAGVRFAYLDLSKLLITDSLEKYLDRPVSVYGPARNIPGTRDIVIQVESMQLR